MAKINWVKPDIIKITVRVQQGQVSRARQELTGASLAPKNQATFDELQNKRPQDQDKQIPRHVLESNRASLLNLDVKKFVECLQRIWPGARHMSHRDHFCWQQQQQHSRNETAVCEGSL